MVTCSADTVFKGSAHTSLGGEPLGKHTAHAAVDLKVVSKLEQFCAACNNTMCALSHGIMITSLMTCLSVAGFGAASDVSPLVDTGLAHTRVCSLAEKHESCSLNKSYRQLLTSISECTDRGGEVR